jgi:hypothetical protein
MGAKDFTDLDAWRLSKERQARHQRYNWPAKLPVVSSKYRFEGPHLQAENRAMNR